MDHQERNERAKDRRAVTEAANKQARATRDVARGDARRAGRAAMELKKCISDLAEIAPKSLAKKSDVELAEFQASYPDGAPQRFLAMNEWNRRLVARQVKATQFATFAGFLGILLGWVLASYNFEKIRKEQLEQRDSKNVQEKTEDAHQRQDPDQVAPEAKVEPTLE